MVAAALGGRLDPNVMDTIPGLSSSKLSDKMSVMAIVGASLRSPWWRNILGLLLQKAVDETSMIPQILTLTRSLQDVDQQRKAFNQQTFTRLKQWRQSLNPEATQKLENRLTELLQADVDTLTLLQGCISTSSLPTWVEEADSSACSAAGKLAAAAAGLSARAAALGEILELPDLRKQCEELATRFENEAALDLALAAARELAQSPSQGRAAKAVNLLVAWSVARWR